MLGGFTLAHNYACVRERNRHTDSRIDRPRDRQTEVSRSFKSIDVREYVMIAWRFYAFSYVSVREKQTDTQTDRQRAEV